MPVRRHRGGRERGFGGSAPAPLFLKSEELEAAGLGDRLEAFPRNNRQWTKSRSSASTGRQANAPGQLPEQRRDSFGVVG